MAKKIWNIFRSAKDAADAAKYTLLAIGAGAVVVWTFIIALVKAIQALPLGWQAFGVFGVFLLSMLAVKGITFVWANTIALWLAKRRWISNPEQYCTQQHITDDQRFLSNLAWRLRNEERENFSRFLEVSYRVAMDNIYHLSDPYVVFIISVRTFSVFEQVIARKIEGKIFESESRVGPTPQKANSSLGLSLKRGGKITFQVEQHISVDLRDVWVGDGSERKLSFDLSGLFISVETINPETAQPMDEKSLRRPDTRLDAVLTTATNTKWLADKKAMLSTPDIQHAPPESTV